MLTYNEVQQIHNKLSSENTDIADDNLDEEITSIIYYVDKIDCDKETTLVHRHIDIEYSFGEYYVISEGTPLFDAVCSLCSLQLQSELQETVLFSKLNCHK